jgi:hypothetical protein
MRVASRSMTSQPGSDLPAISSHGNPAGVASTIAQARSRALARALAALARVRLSASSRVRRTVVSDGGAPKTGSSWDTTSISDMLVAPSAIEAATDTSAIPRSTCGDFRGRASAGPSSPVSPARSAASRSSTAPACPASPFPSAVTFSP